MEQSPLKKAMPWLLGWLVLNLLQAGLTGLAHDEAYYWVYSRDLAAGYCEQPPATAWWVWAGYALIPHELGVRLVAVLSTTFALGLGFWLSGVRKPVYYFLPAFTMLLFHFGGFFAAPDIPLIFFSSLFLWALKVFLEKNTALSALCCGFALAGMGWSKYHGAVLALCLLAANLWMFKRPLAWLAGGFALLLYLPHLLWMHAHGYPAVYFHFFDRSPGEWSFDYPLLFLLSQLILYGPLSALPVWHASARSPAADAFSRSLKFATFGVPLFFFLLSFFTRVEGNWTATAALPMLILASRYFEQHVREWKRVKILAAPSLLLLLAGRIWLLTDFLPEGWNQRAEFHHWKTWAAEVAAHSQGLPVLFTDNYQRASKYLFYSGRPGFGVSTERSGMTQFDLWAEKEAEYLGKPVMLHACWCGKPDTFPDPWGGMVKLTRIDSFLSFNRVNMIPAETSPQIAAGEERFMKVTLENPTEDTVIFFRDKENLLLDMGYVIMEGNQEVILLHFPWYESIPFLPPHGKATVEMPVKFPRHKGKYRMRYFIAVKETFPGRNMNWIRVRVN